jgi:hypothetical protein
LSSWILRREKNSVCYFFFATGFLAGAFFFALATGFFAAVFFAAGFAAAFFAAGFFAVVAIETSLVKEWVWEPLNKVNELNVLGGGPCDVLFSRSHHTLQEKIGVWRKFLTTHAKFFCHDGSLDPQNFLQI